MKKNKKLFIITFFIIALILGGFIIYGMAANRAATDAYQENVQQTDVKRSIPVVVESIGIESFAERIVVQGTLESRNKALVTARIPGTIESVLVDEGDTVIAGKTRLFQIDALKLEKAVEMQKQALVVAQCALLEKEIRLEQVQADLEKAKTDYLRYKRLLNEKAVSQDGFEQMALRYEQAGVARKNINTLIDLTKEQKHQARTALAIAEKDLRDSLVYAPINGHVVLRLKEPGETAAPGEPIIKIEDPNIVEAVAYLPANHYGNVHPGKTQVNLRVCDHKIEKAAVNYKSPTIDEKLRTFTIKSVIERPPGAFVPGAMVEMEVIIENRTGPGVSATAIQIRNNKSVIFVVRDKKAHMLEVTTGIENNGRTEISTTKSAEGESVVVQGQFLLNEGAEVVLQKEAG